MTQVLQLKRLKSAIEIGRPCTMLSKQHATVKQIIE